VFHFVIARDLASWDAASPPMSAKIVSAASLTLWIGVVLAGRWTGHLSG